MMWVYIKIDWLINCYNSSINVGLIDTEVLFVACDMSNFNHDSTAVLLILEWSNTKRSIKSTFTGQHTKLMNVHLPWRLI